MFYLIQHWGDTKINSIKAYFLNNISKKLHFPHVCPVVGDVTYVEILNDDTGKPRGSAIVEFQSPDLVRKAVNKMHRFETKGRKLVIKEVSL